MELGGYGFEKSELIQLAEKIYELNGEKQQLELQLFSEEFHRKNIPKREDMTFRRIMANLPIVIVFLLLSFMLLVLIILCIFAKQEEKIGYAFPMLNVGLFLVFIAGAGWKLLKEEMQMLVLFAYNSNSDKAMRFAKKHGIRTFQDDRIRCEDRIANLKVRIKAIDDQLMELEGRQEEIINEKKKREDVLKKYDVIKDDLKDSAPSDNKGILSLKSDDLDGADISELFDYYDKEESYARYIMKDYQFKLDSIDKEISMIDEDFDKVKKKIKIYLIVFVLAIIIQGAIPGIAGNVTSVLCLIVGLTAFFALERACRGSVVRYLVEQESPFVREYCLKNDIIPAKYRRQEIVTNLKNYEDTIKTIKTKKKELDSL
ncbi:MAG: hypothetical protein IJ661_06925 [Lachnospiraceae bacterium]|nr:hypothetical protein [Lachnospiraceae bacterium]